MPAFIEIEKCFSAKNKKRRLTGEVLLCLNVRRLCLGVSITDKKIKIKKKY